MDYDKLLTNAIQEGITEGVKAKLASGYNSPLDPIIKDLLTANDAKFRKLLSTAITSAVDNADFEKQIVAQVHHKLANLLVSRFGGELEKQVNSLKSDPTTRARITLAIEQIVAESSATTV